ncbi:integrin alpha-7 isoform X2 [Erpetoichthys calabaricus]|uniref:integrin alpha-7 isoform X2 n=1 Tax=Erpetoichthys calabaricus TaxID=27687 RepID=UPI00109FA1C2|nr:integrin alpha-7 isoform X2 [Erpetoichthys calabaricus]
MLSFFTKSSCFLLFCWCTFLSQLPLYLGFNLDVTNTLIKEGEPGSLFGFSVALHQQVNPQQQNWILVGAPQASGLQTQKSKRTGALYQCPITAEQQDCERVDIDEDEAIDRESKENQWLGVTVKSQGIGGKVVTCAHLYELRQRVKRPSETRDPIGRCYVLSDDLSVRDDLDGGEWKFCEGRPQGHEQFGFCQQGISAGFTPDHSYILFGAPGTYNWKGLLFMTSTVEEMLVYKTLEPSERNSGFEDIARNSYLGFSVDSAQGITGRRVLSFVAGAPRANHTGAVVLLQKDNVYRLVPEHILWGEELASSFGYSVAVADLNSDGWTDLVVGAPNFFDRKEEIGGAVYVYMNPSGHWERATPIRLNGTYDSMFGLSVSNVGDLNQDGFTDIAVGAPFDGDGKVYIYLGGASGINTKPTQVLDGVSVAVKHFGYSISGGLDIDGNAYPDLVVGSLSDIIVLYRSRPVIHVKNELFINPSNIDLQQKNCAGRDEVCVKVRACFTYTAHPKAYSPHIVLSVIFEADAERRKLGLPHRVSFLRRKEGETEYQHTTEVVLRGQSNRECHTEEFQLQENIRDKLRPISVSFTYSIKDARLGHQLINQLGALLPVLNAAIPNTVHTEVNFLREGCGDDKICQSNLRLAFRFGRRAPGSENFIPLDIEEEDGIPVFALSGQKDVALEVTITNHPSNPRKPMADGDDAHAAQLFVHLPDSLSYSGFRGPQDKQLVCVPNTNGSQAECELGNPLKRNAVLTFFLILSTSGITIETTELAVGLQLATISEQPDLPPVVAKARVVIELPLSISGVSSSHQLFFSGTVKGESAMTTVEEIGSLVEYEFTVANPVKNLQTLGSAFLNVMWPYEVANGKWLLYPTRIQFIDDRNSHCTSSHRINPLGLTLDSQSLTGQRASQLRRGRSTEEEMRSTGYETIGRTTPAVAASERRKSLSLDCSLGSARCMLLQCPLHNFDGSAKLKIQGRLWNSTFIEDFPNVSDLELLVEANVTIKSHIKHLRLRNANARVAVMVHPEHAISDYEGIPWWIILIAILAGILVLALLVCLLWKCGFFRRAQYKDTVPQYHAVKIPKEDRSQFQDEKSGTLKKKEWATHWNERDGTS